MCYENEGNIVSNDKIGELQIPVEKLEQSEVGEKKRHLSSPHCFLTWQGAGTLTVPGQL